MIHIYKIDSIIWSLLQKLALIVISYGSALEMELIKLADLSKNFKACFNNFIRKGCQ